MITRSKANPSASKNIFDGSLGFHSLPEELLCLIVDEITTREVTDTPWQ